MEFKAPPGVFDILPKDQKDLWKSSYLWSWVEETVRKLAKVYMLEEIRTPIFERTELFCRGVGDTTDIVTKEMYSFTDKGGRNLTLRPEGTASVIRAFLENRMDQIAKEHRLFYICPMFRYERSQAGRYRQHHQIGVEIIGSSRPETDAELIDLAYTLYSNLGLKNLSISINSIGNADTRIRYKEALKTYLVAHFDSLSPDSQIRFEKNPLRILDSKNPGDQLIVAGAPNILDFLDSESSAHFESTLQLLKELDIPFQVNPLLVRGLDYYNKTVFEIVSTNLGAQNSVGGGGRYDGLIQRLGGPDLPSCGFGTGMERILQAVIQQNSALPEPQKPDLFLICFSEAAKAVCFQIQKEARVAGISIQTDFSGKKLNKIMGTAHESGAAFVAVIGDDEIKDRFVNLKEMQPGKVTKIAFDELIKTLTLYRKSHV